MSDNVRALVAKIENELEGRTVVTVAWDDLAPVVGGNTQPEWQLIKLHRFASDHGWRCRVAPSREGAEFCRKPPGRDLGWRWPQNMDGEARS